MRPSSLRAKMPSSPKLPRGLWASRAEQWINCPGSPRLVNALPPEEQFRETEYTRLGSAAHALAERCLMGGKNPSAFRGMFVAQKDNGGGYKTWHVQKKPGSLFNLPVDDEMIEPVQRYVDYLRRRALELPWHELRIEERVEPVPGLRGRADAILLDPVLGQLEVVDYKHGAGRAVSPEENPQAMFYALGALRSVGGQKVHQVRLTIVQPRSFHNLGGDGVKPWDTTAERLQEWGGELEAAAAKTADPEAPLRPGTWCDWCPAAGTCPALREWVKEETKAAFASVPIPVSPETKLPLPTTPEQLSRALNAIPVIDAWSREVQGLAFRTLERGEPVPGYKLVQKRANRKWGDPEAMMARLQEAGYSEEDLFDVRPKSPAKIEKLPGVSKELVAKHVVKPEGGVTLVPEDDPRDAVQPSSSITASSPIDQKD